VTLGLNNDIYRVYPAIGSLYAQDNINFSGMILNFGLRMDFWFPGKYVDDAVENPDVVTIPDETRKIIRMILSMVRQQKMERKIKSTTWYFSSCF
jgi:hypothetical protein